MGTVTTGAESGTTRSRSWGTSPSSGVPSAAARSSSHVPEADGGAGSRPEKRAPSTARRARPAGPVSRRHAAVASATLAVPLVRITVPSGIATRSGPGTSGSSGRARYSGYRAVSSRPARNAGSATLTRRSTERRLPLEARRYRSDSRGPSRRVARPSESSAIGAPRHGSPGPRVHRMARVAAGTSSVTVTLSPRRTVARSTARRTGARASTMARSGCQNAAARPAPGDDATNSTAPNAAVPAPIMSEVRVPRANSRPTAGAARSTTAAARASASPKSSALAPALAPGASTPTTLPARVPAVVSTSRPTAAAAAGRPARRTSHTAAPAVPAIRSHATTTAATRGASVSPAPAIANATPALVSSTAPARARACGPPSRRSRRAVSVTASRSRRK